MMCVRMVFLLFFLLVTILKPDSLPAYPVDGYSSTGIRRLEHLRLVVEKQLSGSLPVAGALKSLSAIKLNLLGSHGETLAALPSPDPHLQREIEGLFPNRHESYSLALLDITPGRPVRFAHRLADRQFSPGSVGKLAIVAGLFKELKILYPDSHLMRAELLRERQIIAGAWIHSDHHSVPIYTPEDRSFISRSIREGDKFSLYEWVDHMLSASANAAASTVWKEVMLMRHFVRQYPPSSGEEEIFFRSTPRETLRNTAMSIVNDPLRDIGIKSGEWQLGSFFTGAGKKIVPGGGQSTANPLGFLKFLVALERGKVVDEWSSLEIKRLMYMTARRIRYASSPSLNNAAVYYKSGSLYRCRPEQGFKCLKYMGNVDNYMNSAAIVEQPDGCIYLVALMSNVLRRNSAVEHQSLATFIDRILRR